MSSKEKKVTLNDVALQAGVSPATASIVLSGSNRVHISDETKKLVIDIANCLGYKARSKSTKKTFSFGENKKIALITDPIDQDVFIKAINGASDTASYNGYALHILSKSASENMLDKQYLISEKFAGIIVSSSTTREIDSFQFPINFPVVLLNCYTQKGNEWPSIVPADLQGGYTVTEHLIEQGCRKIAYIGGEEWMKANIDRYDGYRRAMSSYDLTVSKKLVINCNWKISKSYIATKQLMTQKLRPDAIFSASDNMSIGIYMALSELGIKIPDDILVASYDDTDTACELTPKLTSYKLPYYEMGQLAVETLIQLISGSTILKRHIKHESSLISRQSSTRSL